MADLSIIQKIKLLFDTAISTPFFITYALTGIIIIIFMIIDIKKQKKFSKFIYIVSGIFLITFFIVKYFNLLLKVIDTFVEILLKALYFPNLGIYIVMLMIVNITFIYNVISKKSTKASKIVSSVISVIIDFIFILIVGIISSEKIDITSEVKLYSDSTILTLLQISMALFASLYLLLGLIKIKTRLTKYDKKNTNRVEIDIKNAIPKEYVEIHKVISFGDKSD